MRASLQPLSRWGYTCLHAFSCNLWFHPITFGSCTELRQIVVFQPILSRMFFSNLFEAHDSMLKQRKSLARRNPKFYTIGGISFGVFIDNFLIFSNRIGTILAFAYLGTTVYRKRTIYSSITRDTQSSEYRPLDNFLSYIRPCRVRTCEPKARYRLFQVLDE